MLFMYRFSFKDIFYWKKYQEVQKWPLMLPMLNIKDFPPEMFSANAPNMKSSRSM